MKIGILGAGHIASTAARLFIGAGHEVALSNSRGPLSLRDLAASLGDHAQVLTIEEAAAFGGVVLEAIPFGQVQVLPAGILNGRPVISAANYFPQRDGPIDMHDFTQTELVARHLDGALVTKAFNTIYWEHLRDQGDRSKPLAKRRVIPMAGDHPEAKEVVAALIRDIGFAPLDLGGLRDGGRLMEPGGPLYNKSVTLEEAEALPDLR